MWHFRLKCHKRVKQNVLQAIICGIKTSTESVQKQASGGLHNERTYVLRVDVFCVSTWKYLASCSIFMRSWVNRKRTEPEPGRCWNICWHGEKPLIVISVATTKVTSGSCMACLIISRFWNTFWKETLVLLCRVSSGSLTALARFKLHAIDRLFPFYGSCDILERWDYKSRA